MDVSSIASMATQMSQSKLASDVQMTVLKRAMDIGTSSAEGLIAAIPTPPQANPPHLGNSIDTFA